MAPSYEYIKYLYLWWIVVFTANSTKQNIYKLSFVHILSFGPNRKLILFSIKHPYGKLLLFLQGEPAWSVNL